MFKKLVSGVTNTATHKLYIKMFESKFNNNLEINKLNRTYEIIHIFENNAPALTKTFTQIEIIF